MPTVSVEELSQAAARHRAAGDVVQAIALLSRCLDEPLERVDRATVLSDLAAMESAVDVDQAIRHYEEVLPLIDDPSGLVRAKIRLARCLAVPMRVHEALDVADDACETAATPEDRFRADLAYISLARLNLDTRPMGRERMRQLVARPLEMAASEPRSAASWRMNRCWRRSPHMTWRLSPRGPSAATRSLTCMTSRPSPVMSPS